MSLGHLLRKIPNWMIVLVLSLLILIVVERVYWSQKPIILFGSYFGPPPLSTDDQLALIKRLQAENAELKAKIVHSTENVPVQMNPQQGRAKADELPMQNVDDFIVQLKHCKGSGSIIKCTLTITNTAEGKDFYISVGGTRLITPDGKEYKSKRQKIGSSDNSYSFGGALSKIPRDVAMEAAVWFSDVKLDFSAVKILEIGTGDFSHVDFRDVPILR